MGEWFKDWFASDFYLSVYSHRNDEDAEIFLNKVLSYIPIDPGSEILDAACGAGRHSILMARKGFKVTAFDLSEPLLEIAAAKNKAQNLDINFFREDLRKVKLDKKFSLILNLFTSFGYFDSDEENFAFIRSAYEMQGKEGYFIFDYFNEAFLRKHVVAESSKIINGLEIKEKRGIKGNRIVKQIEIVQGGDRLNYEESVQLYTFNEIIERFRETGYREVQIFGNYNCGTFEPEESDRLIIIFQK